MLTKVWCSYLCDGVRVGVGLLLDQVDHLFDEVLLAAEAVAQGFLHR
jgi:hypothetical protein